jgi:transcriptional regulator with XRE-family HTH domain
VDPIALRERGLTLSELASRVGVNHGHLSRVWGGEKPLSDDLALRIEHALGEPPGSFHETQAALVRLALGDQSDTGVTGVLYRALRRHQRARGR